MTHTTDNDTPVGLTVSADGELLNWLGVNYVRQTCAPCQGRGVWMGTPCTDCASAEKDALLDVIEREYEAFRRHHAAAQTRESPKGFARLFREWMARTTPAAQECREIAEWLWAAAERLDANDTDVIPPAITQESSDE